MVVSKKKKEYAAKLVKLIEENENIIIVSADNVGSSQMQQIRIALRGIATLLMGKNTTIRKILNNYLEANPGHVIANLLPLINGNVGMVFTNSDVGSIRDMIAENKVPAPARVGGLAPVDVYVEPGPTGCDPGQTAWFQALNIPTKINRGQIEMISRVHILKAGEKVGDSAAALLQKLEIKPFSYSLVTTMIYSAGEVYSATVLDLTEDIMMGKLMSGARAIASLGIKVGYPTLASVTHSINNAFKSCISMGMGTDFKFKQAQEFEDFLSDPSNFVVADAPAAEEAAEVAAESEEESVSAGGAGGLFDGDSDDW